MYERAKGSYFKLSRKKKTELTDMNYLQNVITEKMSRCAAGEQYCLVFMNDEY